MKLAAAPKWLLNSVAAERPSVKSQTPATPLDAPQNISHAQQWLELRAPLAIENQGGEKTTAWVAARLKDFGISEAKALDLMIGHWNETKALPNWDYDDLKKKVRNAYLYFHQKTPGQDARTPAQADFGATTPTQVASEIRKPASLFYLNFDQAAKKATEAGDEPLVLGFLDCGAMSVLYGDSNVGKTFVALDIAASVASGRTWNGRRVKKGLVVYVAAEGSRGIYKRIEAWRRSREIAEGSVKLALVPCPVDLRSLQGDTKPLADLVRKAEADFGEPAVLIVVDTLSRALAGGDENSSVDMGAFIQNCDRLRFATSTHLMVIHHTGKNKAAGARGWSGVRAAIDTEIEIADRTISVRKQRDIEPAQDIRFDLRQVPLGANANGDPVTSAVAMLRTASEFERLPLDPAAEVMWESFQLAAKEIAPGGDWRSTIVDTDAWEMAFRELRAGPAANAAANRGLSPRNMRHLRQTVKESGYVRETSRDQWVSV